MNNLPPELQQQFKKKVNKKKEQGRKFVAFLTVGAIAYGLISAAGMDVENVAGYDIERNLYTNTYTVENKGATLKVAGEKSLTIDTSGPVFHNGQQVDTYLVDMFAKQDSEKNNTKEIKPTSIDDITKNRIQVANLPGEIKERIKTIQDKEAVKNTSEKKNTM